MIEIKHIRSDDLLTIISYITYSGYKAVVEFIDYNEEFDCLVYNISILTTGDTND